MAGMCYYSRLSQTLMTKKVQGGFYCCSSAPNNQKVKTQTPKFLKVAVTGVTELLRLLSSPTRNRMGISDDEDPLVSNVEDVLKIIKSDYEKAYFVTGLFTSGIYAEDCVFEDPTIKFRGRDLYSRNLQLLVPFFDSPSIKLEKIEKGNDSNADVIVAYWKLRTSLKLPWQPLISVDGKTVYDLGEQLKIVKHVESWNISALEAIGQIFTPGLRSSGSLFSSAHCNTLEHDGDGDKETDNGVDIGPGNADKLFLINFFSAPPISGQTPPSPTWNTKTPCSCPFPCPNL